MPRRPATESPEARALRELDEEMERYSDAIAADWGPAPGSDVVSDDRKVELWGRTDPKADYDAIYGMLTTTGVPPEMLDPDGADDVTLAIVKEVPEMAPYYQQAVEPDLADALSTLAEYPMRLGLLTDLEDDPEAMVKEAERLDRLWSRRNGGTAAPAPRTGVAVAQPEVAGALAAMDDEAGEPVYGGY